ncbi:MAG: carboxypeptidase regulatory-like domain-containing protein, partial [Chitinispirillaceae bacterium]|nr:carboxypeptidase regulatory-like domain-containing protein [Chitinispirillaceae bacterium]
MNMLKSTLLALVAAIALGMLFTCGRNPIAGNGTQTGNPVVAMLCNPGGSPAVNAKVCFYHRDNDPRPDSGEGVIDSALTDTNGTYTVTLAAGAYTLVASGDSGLAYRDSLAVAGGDTVKPDPDTLRPAGSVRGVVRLEEGGDPRTIFVLFMGTRTFTWPDDSLGNFTSGLMAGGRYRVRVITTTPDYLPLDDTLEVTAGQEDTLADTLILKYNGIPVPKNLQIQYDTMMQIVTLTWDSASANRVDYYNIYRRNVTADSTPVKINASPVRTNSYCDSTGTQDITYEYRVAAVDT